MAHLTIQELSDLCDAMMGRMGLELLPATTKANREDTLEDLLASLGMSDLLASENDTFEERFLGKILVVGASVVNVDKLRSIARKKGFDPDDLSFSSNIPDSSTSTSARYAARWATPQSLQAPCRTRLRAPTKPQASSLALRTIRTSTRHSLKCRRETISRSPTTASSKRLGNCHNTSAHK